MSIYLYLSPSCRVAHRAFTVHFHFSLSAASDRTSSQFLHPALPLSFSTVLLHVVLGLPCFLLPSCVQVNAMLQSFPLSCRESLWVIMGKYGIPEKIIRIVRLLYEDFQCGVEDQGETGKWFNIKTRVKQGCNMLGFIFLVVMDWILRRSVGEGENGIRWKFASTLDDLDFADDIALLSSTKHHIQEKTARLDDEARRVGLKINLEKTKMLRINAKQHVNIAVNGKEIEDVGEFTYLGAKICREGGGMKDLRNRLSKARSAYTRLKRIWNSKKITRRTKIKLYNFTSRWYFRFCYTVARLGR